MKSLDYNNMADAYSRHRKVNQLVMGELLSKTTMSPKSRVLEVGCGTAAHIQALAEATGCEGWGIDPSTEMVHHAPDDVVRLVEARAEDLPFKPDFFDFIFSKDVIHHVKNTAQYFSEAFRVLKPDGLICTATDSEQIIKNRKPLSQYWPGTVKADLERYPRIIALCQQMADAGFVGIQENEQQTIFPITDPSTYEEKAFSCLHLISDEEFQNGMRQLKVDLQRRPVEGTSAYVFLWGRRKSSIAH
jgi:ubiquinone/menaquinone biosynthesis C-methylase UbiE